MPWQQINARVPSHDVARVESLLTLAGALSIVLEDAADVPLYEPTPGETPLWPLVVVEALFPEEADIAAVEAWLMRELGPSADISTAQVPDLDPATAPGAAFAPRRFGERLWLVPSDQPAPPGAEVVVRLNQGLAFGTGEHPTTALCLEWLDAQRPAGARVLDFGCGSGVLALAALALGASAAYAVDSDPQALTATARNAELNGLADQLWIGEADALPNAPVDIVLANILAGPLVALTDDFAARLRSGGHAVLSGVLAEQREAVVTAYARRFEQLEVAEQDGWLRLVFRKH